MHETLRFNNFQPVPQEHPLGCSVACVASLCGLSYQNALKLFQITEHAWIRGFYCSEIVYALDAANIKYNYQEIQAAENSDKINIVGAIVFTKPNLNYPLGHFLLKVATGWMNPWANFPQMVPIVPAIQKELPGIVSHVIYPEHN